MRQWLVAAALFAGALYLYTRHNDFAFWYHPDESTKVEQIHAGTRNFHHSLLLLTATDFAKWFARGNLDCQAIVQLGRTCSAIFAATAVAAFSWLGFFRFGLRGGIAVGVIMLLQRRPYELAHFMKEDCAMLAGIALTFVALETFWRRPSVVRAALLGAAAAGAASGKYVGIVMLLPALGVIIAGRSSLSLRRGLSAMAGAFLVVLVVINFRAVLSFSMMLGGLNREIEHLNSRSGIEFHYSPLGWVRYFLEISPLLLLFFVAHLVSSVRSFRGRSLPHLLLTAFPLAWGLLLSLSSKQGGRYALPMTETAALLGVIGALELWSRAAARGFAPAKGALVGALICSGLYDLGRTAMFDRAFQRDHRRELVEWINQNVPRTAAMVLDERVGLPAQTSSEPARWCKVPRLVAQKVRVALFAADLGSLDQLRAEGVSYVGVAEGRYDVFFQEGHSATKGKEDLFEQRSEFYHRLFVEGTVVWKRETGDVGTLNPGLRLYRISPGLPQWP